MASARVPGPLGLLRTDALSGHAQVMGGATSTVPQPNGLAHPTPARAIQSAPRLVSLTVTHGARKDSTQPRLWNSYLFEDQYERVIVLAKTEPDQRSAWEQIYWNCSGGKPITGLGYYGWSIPRSKTGVFRVAASLGGITAELRVSVGTLVNSTGSRDSGGTLGTPINPIGTHRKINLYGDHETDALGFEDYSALKVYQDAGKNHLRPLTKASPNAPAPDGPGLPDGCASDICMRAVPFYSPSYYAINRIRNKTRCRITYYAVMDSHPAAFLAAFPDASHIQHNRVNRSSWFNVIEYPREAIWSPVSYSGLVIPPPDSQPDGSKRRVYEGED